MLCRRKARGQHEQKAREAAGLDQRLHTLARPPDQDVITRGPHHALAEPLMQLHAEAKAIRGLIDPRLRLPRRRRPIGACVDFDVIEVRRVRLQSITRRHPGWWRQERLVFGISPTSGTDAKVHGAVTKRSAHGSTKQMINASRILVAL